MHNDHELSFLIQWESKTDIPLQTSDVARKYPWVNTGRRFTADFTYPEGMVYIELDGAVFVTGGHSSGAGITKDREKDAIAAVRGWTAVRIPTTNIDKMLPLAIEICKRRKAMVEALDSIGFRF